MPRAATDAPTYVYVCWSGDDLLYVGTTRFLEKRQGEHKAYSRWWSKVDAVDVQWHPCRGTAEAVERSLIAQYRPAHNSRYHFAGRGPGG